MFLCFIVYSYSTGGFVAAVKKMYRLISSHIHTLHFVSQFATRAQHSLECLYHFITWFSHYQKYPSCLLAKEMFQECFGRKPFFFVMWVSERDFCSPEDRYSCKWNTFCSQLTENGKRDVVCIQSRILKFSSTQAAKFWMFYEYHYR
jgi:hypothetical protein